MDMLKTMRFIRGAVATSNLVPEMKHFWIKDGSIKAYNGVIVLQSPIDFNVNCMPLAVPLVSAITKCEDVMSLGMSESGRLRVQSGRFKAFIPCLEEEMPDLDPQGEMVELDGKTLMQAITAVVGFIGNDASRPFVNGVYLTGKSAFATNNVCVVEYWIGADLPLTANIPIEAVKEMLRIGEPPTHAQVSEFSITFHYEDGRWLRTQLYSTDWPPLQPILERPASQLPLPATLFEALEIIKPFLEKDSNVYLRDGAVHTSPVEGIGASCDVPGLIDEGIYKLQMLHLLDGIATHADLSQYPNPCMFWGGKLRGAIIGLRP